jgi:mannosyltransferase OCH1-like enzyme
MNIKNLKYVDTLTNYDINVEKFEYTYSIKNKRIYLNSNHMTDYIDINNSDNEIILTQKDGYLLSSHNYIPKNIFQTHKSMEYIETKPEILNAVNSWKKYDGEFKYQFYNDSQAEQFIKDNFDDDTYTAYKKLPIPVMKADLWRYCIIYKYGGIYADTDTILKVDPNIFLKNDCLLAVVPENDCAYLCQWVFAAPAKSEILNNIIKLSVKRILEMNEIKGQHVTHYLTGPALFTDAIKDYLIKNNKTVFDSICKYIDYYDSCLYVFENGNFHNNIVKHLFHGDEGWKKEINNI